MTQPDFSQSFADLVADHQPRLAGYIRSLVFDEQASKDILQETNVTILKKSREFEMGTNFAAWAFRIAYFEVLKWRRNQGRDRLHFDDDLIASVAATIEESTGEYDRRLEHLADCIEELPERQREAVERRYLRNETVKDIAVELGFKANAAAQLLFRARANLMKCVERRIKATGGSRDGQPKAARRAKEPRGGD